MKKIDFSRHSIADVKGWDDGQKLEIQPDFQRREVWALPAKIMLIDSILSGIPLPKIFIASKIQAGNTHRIVIDGQQRISAILLFIHDGFSLNSPYSGVHQGKCFSQLPEQVQHQILSFRLDFNEFENYSDQEMREIYNRVNKYTVALNKQELRRADFPGRFLHLSETLSSWDFFDDAKIFTPVNRRRLLDVEYISELLAIIISGPQDKKSSLDEFYITYSNWPDAEFHACRSKFIHVLDDIQKIFDCKSFHISSTRFKQKSDFYSLFAAIHHLHKSGKQLIEDELDSVREDLEIANSMIEPSAAGVFGEYATRCLSDANSIGSRIWRAEFIANILVGAYDPSNDSQERIKFYTDIIIDLQYGSGMCKTPCHECPICEVEDDFNPDFLVCFKPGKISIDRSIFIHKSCIDKSGFPIVYDTEQQH
jgi:hypothetical protein